MKEGNMAQTQTDNKIEDKLELITAHIKHLGNKIGGELALSPCCCVCAPSRTIFQLFNFFNRQTCHFADKAGIQTTFQHI